MILNIIALLFAIFVPGYMLSFALFPRKNEIDWMERVGLSFAMSVIFIPLLLFLLNSLFAVKLDQFSSWAAVIFFIVIGIIGYLFRSREGTVSYRIRRLLPDFKS